MKKILIITCVFFILPVLSMANDELVLVKEKKDELGMTHQRYQQEYQGVPVFGAELIKHFDQDSREKSTSGRILENIFLDVQPDISQEEAIIKARELWPLEESEVIDAGLYVLNKNFINKALEDKNYLVWRVDLYHHHPTDHQFYFIDAHNGQLVHQLSGIKDVINRRIIDCSYYAVWGTCFLDQLVFGYTYGRSEGQSVRGANPWYFNSDVDNLYTITGGIHDYFYNTYALDGANAQGGIGDGTSALVTNTDVYAYIDPTGVVTCPNAFFDGYSINFCYGMVTTDVVGHEYGHGFLEFSVPDMPYESETGAIHESYADIYGEAVENYINGSNDWINGADITLVSASTRDMTNPQNSSDSLGVMPDRFNSPYFYCGSEDNYGVHHNATVFGHAAYLMAMGGTFNGCTITGIGQAKQEQIFYRAAKEYITTNANFNDLYTALINSCNDLYEAADCNEVIKTLLAVEVDQGGACSGETAVTPDCSAVETAPTVTNVSSDTADGYYKEGEIIDIDVTFSKAVTSTGEVTVKLETGENDRQCKFTVSNETSGTCNYTIKDGDASNDLTVKNITGTLTDQYGNSMADLTPTINLAANKDIVVDTTKPKAPKKLKIYTSPKKKKRIKTINPRKYKKTVKAKTLKPYFKWTAVNGVNKVYVRFSYKNLKKKAVKKGKYKQSARTFAGKIKKPNKKYKLYMVLRDRAGNVSKLKTLVNYKLL